VHIVVTVSTALSRLAVTASLVRLSETRPLAEGLVGAGLRALGSTTASGGAGAGLARNSAAPPRIVRGSVTRCRVRATDFATFGPIGIDERDAARLDSRLRNLDAHERKTAVVEYDELGGKLALGACEHRPRRGDDGFDHLWISF
jgi:hypothetical protein